MGIIVVVPPTYGGTYVRACMHACMHASWIYLSLARRLSVWRASQLARNHSDCYVTRTLNKDVIDYSLLNSQL